jgi:hypothetical protein
MAECHVQWLLAVADPSCSLAPQHTCHHSNRTLPGQAGQSAYPCPELAAANISVPYYVDNFWYTHPKGLHAAVVFNTNVFGTKNASLVKPGPGLNSRIWPVEEPVSGKWFSKDPEWGIGYVYCRDQPAEYKVALRCR